MLVRASLSIGLIHDQHEVLEVPDDDLEGLNDTARDDVIYSYVNDWAQNLIDIGWSPAEEGDEEGEGW